MADRTRDRVNDHAAQAQNKPDLGAAAGLGSKWPELAQRPDEGVCSEFGAGVHRVGRAADGQERVHPEYDRGRMADLGTRPARATIPL
jgi:hypothetical protein